MATSNRRVFKTKKVLSGVRSEYRAWKEWDEGDVLVGEFVNFRPNKMNAEKNDSVIQVVESFFSDKKEQKRLAPGTLVTLNSAGQFDKGMDQLESGDLFQVTYNGNNEMEGGKFAGKSAHAMEVIQVEEDDGSEQEEEEEEEEEDDL